MRGGGGGGVQAVCRGGGEMGENGCRKKNTVPKVKGTRLVYWIKI